MTVVDDVDADTGFDIVIPLSIQLQNQISTNDFKIRKLFIFELL